MLKLTGLLTTAALTLLGGCATEPVATSDARLTTSVLAPGMTQHRPGTAALTFKRDTGASNSVCSFRLYIDGTPFADLRTGEIVTIYANPGEHIFGVRSNGICFAGNAEMQAVVKAGDRKVYRVSVNSGGAIALQPTAF